MALIILQQILVMALYMLIGLALYRAGKMTDEGSETLASLLAYVVIPAMLVNSFLVEFSPFFLCSFLHILKLRYYICNNEKKRVALYVMHSFSLF